VQTIRVHEPGGPDAMSLDTLDTPEPGDGEVRVRIEACGVNFIDVYQRSGQYPKPPPVPLGLEGAGVVEAGALPAGTRVAWTGVPGSYATHVIAPADRVVVLPDGVDARAGAAAMLQGMTAHYLSQSTYPIAAGDRCLIHAAAGGVGLLLCQMAKRAGATVFGTVSTEEKAELARAAGADEVILYTKTDFAEVATHMNVVYDSVGRDTFDRSLTCLAPRGTLVLFGQSSGAVEPFDPQRLNQGGSLYLTRPSLFHYIASRDELVARAGDVLGWIASGELRLRIGAEYPLAEAAEAHRALEGRRTTGKVMLVP
jgi:NADPH2:quinone reductase